MIMFYLLASVCVCVCLCLESLVYASPAGEIRGESSVSSCLLDLNPCVKSSEPGQVRLHMLRRLMSEPVSIGSPSAAPQSPTKQDVYIPARLAIQHTCFFSFDGSLLVICTRPRVGMFACPWVDMQSIFFFFFFRLWTVQRFIFEADFTSPWLTVCWYTMKTAVRAKGDVRLFPVVAPAGKWCDTCIGPQGYIKEQPFRVWGTHESSVYLWSHRNRETLCACVCAVASLHLG